MLHVRPFLIAGQHLWLAAGVVSAWVTVAHEMSAARGCNLALCTNLCMLRRANINATLLLVCRRPAGGMEVRAAPGAALVAGTGGEGVVPGVDGISTWMGRMASSVACSG